jgi:hypothetical protein
MVKKKLALSFVSYALFIICKQKGKRTVASAASYFYQRIQLIFSAIKKTKLPPEIEAPGASKLSKRSKMLKGLQLCPTIFQRFKIRKRFKKLKSFRDFKGVLSDLQGNFEIFMLVSSS